ncbi:30S ribosomal protein S17 [Candidatus Micrarchaeota archaeon RBG_16_49_10]|nr:MAG: 30S ribosomal protein S17 [Candidatus Micrarchaeota archaeon RBG_16_49_10]
MKVNDIGYDVKPPAKACDDADCPFHGQLPVRGKITEARVDSIKMPKTIVVEKDYLKYSTKYERYERTRKKFSVHRPPCFDVKKGDIVRIAECRPLSKTKHFVVIERIKGS